MIERKRQRRYDKQFKREAVLRVINSGRSVADVAQELVTCPPSMYHLRN